MIVQPKERLVRVLNSFWWKDHATKVGDEILLPTPFAHEMRHSGKVEFFDPDPKPIVVEPPPLPPNIIPPDRIPAAIKTKEK